MNTTETPQICIAPGGKTKAETYEGIAFTFCKAALLILILGKFALPVVAGAATVFYLLAFRHGQKESRCVLKFPLLIAAVWGIVAAISGYEILKPYFQ